MLCANTQNMHNLPASEPCPANAKWTVENNNNNAKLLYRINRAQILTNWEIRSSYKAAARREGNNTPTRPNVTLVVKSSSNSGDVIDKCVTLDFV